MLPCRTPQISGIKSEKYPFHFTDVKDLLSQLCNIIMNFAGQFLLSSLSNKIHLFSLSNALDISMEQRLTEEPLSKK